MHRRSLLAAVTASSATIAGCGATEAIGRQDTATGAEVPSDPDDPIAEATIGFPAADRSPHRIRCWNLSDERQSVGLELEADDSSFDGSYDLEPEAHVLVLVHEADAYVVSVTIDDTVVGTTALEADSFDEPCPATELFVLEDEQFEAETDEDSDHC